MLDSVLQSLCSCFLCGLDAPLGEGPRDILQYPALTGAKELEEADRQHLRRTDRYGLQHRLIAFFLCSTGVSCTLAGLTDCCPDTQTECRRKAHPRNHRRAQQRTKRPNTLAELPRPRVFQPNIRCKRSTRGYTRLADHFTCAKLLFFRQ